MDNSYNSSCNRSERSSLGLLIYYLVNISNLKLITNLFY